MVQQGQQEQELEQQGVEDAVAGCTGELLSRNAVFGPGCLVAAQDFFLRYGGSPNQLGGEGTHNTLSTGYRPLHVLSSGPAAGRTDPLQMILLHAM
jgi:hypothetical protein